MMTDSNDSTSSSSCSTPSPAGGFPGVGGDDIYRDDAVNLGLFDTITHFSVATDLDPNRDYRCVVSTPGQKEAHGSGHGGGVGGPTI